MRSSARSPSKNQFRAVSPHCYRKEMMKMPWYINPVLTCKVLNKIANRYERSVLQDLRSVLDRATELIWRKQEQYYESNQQKGGGFMIIDT